MGDISMPEHEYDALMEQIAQLTSQRDMAVKALEYYANPARTCDDHWDDEGRVARKALAAIRGGGA